jgi:hypothetical protein
LIDFSSVASAAGEKTHAAVTMSPTDNHRTCSPARKEVRERVFLLIVAGNGGMGRSRILFAEMAHVKALFYSRYPTREIASEATAARA